MAQKKNIDQNLIRDLSAQNLPISEIAGRAGCSKVMVIYYRKKLGIGGDYGSRAAQRWTDERRQKCVALYRSGKTLEQVAGEMSTNLLRVRQALAKLGVPVRPKAAFGSMEANPSWNGGRSIDADGYILVKRPDHEQANNHGYVREHRLVMEGLLGRLLSRSEVVHHLNGDKADNRPENLGLFDSNSDHLTETLQGKCPKWTEDGKRRLRESVERRKKQKHTVDHPKIDAAV